MIRPDRSLDDALAEFLSSVGVARKELVKLGPAAAPEPTAAQRKALVDRLSGVARHARTIVWVWVGVIVALFVMAVGLALWHRDDLAFVGGTILGGSGIMLLLLNQLRAVHLRLVSTEAMLALLPNVSAKDWARVVMSLMNEILKTPA